MALSPAALAEAVLSKGLSPISSSTTSFPWPFSVRATASTVKAVSTFKFLAKLLRVTGTEANSWYGCWEIRVDRVDLSYDVSSTRHLVTRVHVLAYTF